MNKLPISVPILTLNSAATLERCLASVKECVEVVLLDGNSTDGTQDIARRYGARVLRQKETDEPNIRIENFTEMRLKSIAATTQPWIFDLDSDEYASGELIEEMRRITSSADTDSKIAYHIQRKAVIDGRVIEHAHFYPYHYVSFYHKGSGITFKAGKRSHEKLSIPGDVTIVPLSGPVYGPWPSYRDAVKKDDHYLRLMREQAHDAPRRRLRALRASAKNALTATYIVLKAVRMYLRHGLTPDVLPPRYTWRFVRYHLLVSIERLRQSFLRSM